MTPEELITRARTSIGKGIRYKLGAGGLKPNLSMPSNQNDYCDCSGFVCWALGISRMSDHPLYMQFNGGWINTDAMVFDAKQPTGFFELSLTPVVGGIVVYPGTRKMVGHVGIIVATRSVGGAPTVDKVIHCSKGNDTKFGDAVQITDARVFDKPTSIWARYAGLD